MKKNVSLFVLFCTSFASLFGASVTVRTADDLAVAINDAADNEKESTKITIIGTLQGNFFVPETRYPIVLAGKKGTDPTLDGQGLGPVLTVDLGATVVVKDITIANGEGSTTYGGGGGIVNLGRLELEQVTVRGGVSTSQNGSSLYGGGIFNDNHMLIKECTIEGNVADFGGGIYNRNKMTIINSSINNNSLTSNRDYSYGGGIFNDGDLKVFRSLFEGNRATKGYSGAVYTEGHMVIKDSIIRNNWAYHNTGGLENDIYMRIENCSIYDNVAEYGVGGGIYNDYGTMILKNSSVYNNTAKNNNGGGVYNDWYLKVKNSKIYDNITLTGNGGGIFNNWILSVKKSSINNNSALAGNGGGIYNNGQGGENLDPSRFASVYKSEIEGNFAALGGGIANVGGAFFEVIDSKVSNNIANEGTNENIYNVPPSELVIKKFS